MKMLCIGDTQGGDQVDLVGREGIIIPESLCYLTGYQRDCLGMEGAVAIPVAMRQVKYVAPEFIGVTMFDSDTWTASRFMMP